MNNTGTVKVGESKNNFNVTQIISNNPLNGTQKIKYNTFNLLF